MKTYFILFLCTNIPISHDINCEVGVSDDLGVFGSQCVVKTQKYSNIILKTLKEFIITT